MKGGQKEEEIVNIERSSTKLGKRSQIRNAKTPDCSQGSFVHLDVSDFKADLRFSLFLLLSLPSKANSRHNFSSQNISVKQHYPSPLSVCTVCVCVCVCVCACVRACARVVRSCVRACARACVRACASLCACVRAFMLYALNFDKYAFVENV